MHLAPGIGHHQLQKLSPQHLQSFYNKKLEEGLSSTTVISFHNVLHKALKTAVRWNLIARNTCDLVSPPRRKRFEIQPLNMQQIHQFLAVTHGHRQEALFILALATGMRRGELLALKWQDLDLEQRELRVRDTKTMNSEWMIHLPEDMTEMLKQHRLHQAEARLEAGPARSHLDLVFSDRTGGLLRPEHLLKGFHEILQQAELPRLRFHDLRVARWEELSARLRTAKEGLDGAQAGGLDLYNNTSPL